MTRTIYKCNHCGEVLDRSKMRRLSYKRYDNQEVYARFINMKDINLCRECAKEFREWLKGEKK